MTTMKVLREGQNNTRTDMAALESLYTLISDRLTAAAVEIFEAVEKTLIEYQREINRSKQEIDHLRSLVRCPEVRSASDQSHSCDKEASPERCHEEDQAPDVSTEHQSTLHGKKDQHGPSCRQQRDSTVCLRRGHKDLCSHLYRILNIKQTEDIKAEPDVGEFITSPSTREAELHYGINAESCGLQQETLKDRPEITDEQHYPEQDWSPCQDHEDCDPHEIKVEKLTSSSSQEETEHEYELPLQSERRVYDEPRSSSPKHDQTLSNQTFHTTEEKRRDAEGEDCELSSYSVNPDCPAPQGEYGENTEHVVNGESIKLKGTRKKKRKNSNLCSEGGQYIGTDEDVSDLSMYGGDTCPIWPKRLKESSQLEEHVKIHTDMLQVLLQKVDSVESNMIKLMNCVMGIQRPNCEDADLDLQAAKSLHELEEFEERLKDAKFRRRVTHHLGLIGGFTPGECVRRIMRTLASSTVWSNYSLHGKRSKRPLIESTVCTVIKQAVMRSKPGLAEKDAEKLIAETLKHSPAMAKKDVQKNQERQCPELLLVKEEDDQTCIF